MSNLEEQTKKVRPILSDADLESLGIHKKTVYKFKVCLIGEIAVGKTSIIERYITGNFNNEYNCTCGTEYRLKTVSREGYGAAEFLGYLVWSLRQRIPCHAEGLRKVSGQG